MTKGRGAYSGFTLIELMLVVVLLALVVGLAAPSISSGIEGARLRASARGLAATLGQTRVMAMREAVPFRVDLAPGGVIVRAWGEDEPRRELALDSPVGPGPGGAEAIVFYPAGSSSGGAFAVGTGKDSYTVRVVASTGRVRVSAEGP